MTLFIKKGKSLTSRLSTETGLMTWLEGPYHDRASERVISADRLLCIAGGVGITGVLAFAATNPNAKLYWSLGEGDEALARELEDVTNLVLDESEVRIGLRFDVRDVLEAEAAPIRDCGQRRTIGVVVCGPPGLCDEVRTVVSALGRQETRGVTYLLAVEAFSW